MPGQADLAIIPRNPNYSGFRHYQITQFGLDKTPLEQFVIYLQKLFTLDRGVSYFYKKPVIGILAVDLSWTLLLVGTATIFTVLIGMAIGAYAAVRRGKPFDYLSTGFAIFFYGMPILWLRILLPTALHPRAPPPPPVFRWAPLPV